MSIAISSKQPRIDHFLCEAIGLMWFASDFFFLLKCCRQLNLHEKAPDFLNENRQNTVKRHDYSFSLHYSLAYDFIKIKTKGKPTFSKHVVNLYAYGSELHDGQHDNWVLDTVRQQNAHSITLPQSQAMQRCRTIYDVTTQLCIRVTSVGVAVNLSSNDETYQHL